MVQIIDQIIAAVYSDLALNIQQFLYACKEKMFAKKVTFCKWTIEMKLGFW